MIKPSLKDCGATNASVILWLITTAVGYSGVDFILQRSFESTVEDGGEGKSVPYEFSQCGQRAGHGQRFKKISFSDDVNFRHYFFLYLSDPEFFVPRLDFNLENLPDSLSSARSELFAVFQSSPLSNLRTPPVFR